MGHLAYVLSTSGLTHGRPPYSFPPRLGDVVPIVPYLINSPEYLASKLYPNLLGLPILAKLLSALPGLKLVRRVILDSSRVLNNSD
jgi:hypothetical protein